MSNTSIRVECFRIPIDKSSSNEKLGYLLLKVKGAQTFNPTSNDRVSNTDFWCQCISILYHSIMYCSLNIKSLKF